MRIRLARFLLLTSTVICSLLLSAGISSAQDRFPSKPIQLVAPLAPGTTSDLVARILAERLSQRLGQPVVVQNRTGASGSIAGQFVAKSAPDGYTILIVNSQHSANPALFDNLPYDTLRDFTGVALFAEAPSLIVVPTRLNVKTLKEFVALAKSQPGKLNFATGGIGASDHMATELFMSMTGVRMIHVPYKGGGPAIIDLIAGNVDLGFSTMATAIGPLKTGRLRALGVTSGKRFELLPEVPTIAEAGVAGYESVAWYGLFAPAGTPADVVRRINTETVAILQSDDVRRRLTELGIIPFSSTPEAFATYVQSETARWGKLVRANGLKAQ